MKYSRFERLALVLGALAIVASVFMTPAGQAQSAEVAAQLLLIMVLAAALHWGRNGGFLAALVAISLYVVMRFPLLESQGLSPEIVTMLGTRAAMYALVGIVGGEVASRIKYVFARMESDALVDQVTGLYSPRYAAESIISGVGQWERYKTEFSIVRIVLDKAVYSELRNTRYRQVMKQVAAHARNDVRMVDDLAFCAPATYLVLLPKTPHAGAEVVSERLSKGIIELLGVKPESLVSTVLSAERNASEMRSYAQTLHPLPSETAGPAVPVREHEGAERRGAVPASAQEPSE